MKTVIKIVRRAVIISLISPFILGCAGQTISPKNAATSVAAGAKVVEIVREKAPKFTPYLIIDDFEVCRKLDEKIECVLILSGEVRRVDPSAIECGSGLACMSSEAFLRLLSALEVYCVQDKITCHELARSYKDISGVFLVK